MKSVPVPAASINLRGSCKVTSTQTEENFMSNIINVFVFVQVVCSSYYSYICIHFFFFWYNIYAYIIVAYLISQSLYTYTLKFALTLEGLKLAAAIGAPSTVNTANQRPPRRRKNDPGPSSPHEYSIPSFKDEYSFTY
jgi:hypothetical protein